MLRSAELSLAVAGGKFIAGRVDGTESWREVTALCYCVLLLLLWFLLLLLCELSGPLAPVHHGNTPRLTLMSGPSLALAAAEHNTITNLSFVTS